MWEPLTESEIEQIMEKVAEFMVEKWTAEFLASTPAVWPSAETDMTRG